MKTPLTLIGFLALFPAGAALAGDDCYAPMASWQPREAVARLAQQRGWAVRRIRIDDGCYQIDARDSAGRRVEVTLDPATLALIEVEYDDDDGHDDDHDDAGAGGVAGRGADDDDADRHLSRPRKAHTPQHDDD